MLYPPELQARSEANYAPVQPKRPAEWGSIESAACVMAGLSRE